VAACITKLVLQGGFGTPSLGKGEVVGVSDGTIRKSNGSFLCDHCAICNHSATICDRMSPKLKSTGGGHFGSIFGEEGLTDVSLILV